jgi:hypothetical protein
VLILENQRHEKFAQQLATGKSASEAYVLAGYRPSRKNASRLRTNEGVVARVAELQAVAVRSTAITIESICPELDEANAVAREKGQAAAMVSASTLRAKLAGLLTDRVQVETSNGGMTLDDDNSPEDVAIHMAKEAGVTLSPKELETFMGLMRSWHEATAEFFASCKAKPVNDAVDYERKRLALAASKQAYRN